MLYKIQELKSSIFFDIETTPKVENFENLSLPEKEVWRNKYAKRCFEKETDHQIKLNFANEETYNSDLLKYDLNIQEDVLFNKYAPLYAEFAKVLCISIGVLDDNVKKDIVNLVLNEEGKDPTYDTLSERELLIELRNFLDSRLDLKLAGFNIKGFDIPFLVKRYLINGLVLPKCLQIRNKKPWEVNFLDVMEDWKSMGWEVTSLEALAVTLGLNPPKDKFQAYELSTLLKAKKITLKDVEEYCAKDTNTLIDVALKLSDYIKTRVPSNA